jgi:alpha-1,2-mannosyltransferase
VAQAVDPRPLAGWLAAFRRLGEIGVLGVAPALIALAVIGGAIDSHYAFDFHGSLWQAGRDVLAGRDPYPPATAVGVATGDRFVYPAPVALFFLPLALLPFALAAAFMTALLSAAVAATLAVLGVRDWRCYGAAFLSIPVLHDIRLGAITPLLALGLALVWRWRARVRAAVPLAAIVIAKLFLWPMTVWLVATGRVRVVWRAVVLAAVACVLGWAVIGFVGLVDYPALVRMLADAEQTRGYSVVAGGLALGLGASAARAAAAAVGAVLLVFCWREGRRGFDERSFALALAATLALTPIVWLHYFVLLLVPLSLRRRTFAPLWLIPALYWLTPFEENFGTHWRIAAGLAIATVTLASAAASHRFLPRPAGAARRRG